MLLQFIYEEENDDDDDDDDDSNTDFCKTRNVQMNLVWFHIFLYV